MAIFMAPEAMAVAFSIIGFIVGLKTSRNSESAAPNKPLERAGVNASRPADGANADRSAPRR